MHFNGGAYLRVTEPKTSNGILPITVNGVVQERVTHMPLSSQKLLEKKNDRLRKSNMGHLVAKIEVVGI